MNGQRNGSRPSRVKSRTLDIEALESRRLLAGFPADAFPAGTLNGFLVEALISADESDDARLRQVKVPEHGRRAHEFWKGADWATQNPSIDGAGNNVDHPEWGETGMPLMRITSVEYDDGISLPAGSTRPSARVISNAVVAQDSSIPNASGLSDLTWLWGQFIDHDLDLSDGANPPEPFDIPVPTGDPFFDPTGTGTQTIALNRSAYTPGTGDSIDNPRMQFNKITACIDGSVVYGADADRAAALRSGEGGRLKTSAGELLPFNTGGFENAGGTGESLFLAGDIRSNENAALSAMHTLWVREHNRLADLIGERFRGFSDDEIFEMARSLVTAQLQVITFKGFLPALLGADALAEYQGYQPHMKLGISNLFSTAIYRFGHTMLSPVLQRLNDDGSAADEGPLPLRHAFFRPHELVNHGIDSLLKGAASQAAQELDTQVIDDVRNFLFGQPGADGFDLPSLNIQRGRDHGLADYNQVREDLGLARATDFSQITSDVNLQTRLASVYSDIDEIDVWVGALAEDHVGDSNLGELSTKVIAEQFARIRDADRFWYQLRFSGELLEWLEGVTLGHVIERNTGLTNLQSNVFFATAPEPSVETQDFITKVASFVESLRTQCEVNHKSASNDDDAPDIVPAPAENSVTPLRQDVSNEREQPPRSGLGTTTNQRAGVDKVFETLSTKLDEGARKPISAAGR